MDANPGGPIDLCRLPLVYGSAGTPRSADHLRRFVPTPHFDPQAGPPFGLCVEAPGPTAGLRLPRAAIALRPRPGLRKSALVPLGLRVRSLFRDRFSRFAVSGLFQLESR